MSDKQRWPLSDALIIAETLREALAPCCERILIAGSIRRRKPEVGDIELLYIPRYEQRTIDLLSTGQVNVTDECIERLVACGQLAKRPNKIGNTSWGEKNKLAIHLPTGIPVDLFATNEECWQNYLVCRTGPAESNTAIATAARAKGWQWNPYWCGFHSLSDNGEVRKVTHEREVFEFVGMPYREPWER